MIKKSFKSRRYMFYVKIIAMFIVAICAYQIYLWMKIQSTDDAYIKADITNISAEVSGVITKVLIRENVPVTIGQVIAEIDDTLYRAYLVKAKADVEAAKHEIDSAAQNILLAESKYNNAVILYRLAEESFNINQKELQRTIALNKDNFASQKNLADDTTRMIGIKNALTQAKFDMYASEVNLKLLAIKQMAAQAKYDNAIAAQKIAMHNLEHTIIKSPIDGVLGNSFLAQGNYVRAGSVLCAVVPIENIYIQANFKETQLAKFVPGMPVEITVDAVKNHVIMGTIRGIAPATSAQFSLIPPVNASGNFTKIVQRVPVIIDLNVPKILKKQVVPGMSAVVKVRID